ncbi:MAG: PilZ domain-containing protein [Pseudomonadota bacterium]
MNQNSHTSDRDASRYRRYTRVFFDAETVLTQGDEAWVVQLRDLSFQGMLVRLLPGQSPDPDQPIEATIHLGGDIQISMTCRVANHHDNALGLKCCHIDLDSLTHLRRLVELNLGDIRMLEREFSALGHPGSGD